MVVGGNGAEGNAAELEPCLNDQELATRDVVEGMP